MPDQPPRRSTPAPARWTWIGDLTLLVVTAGSASAPPAPVPDLSRVGVALAGNLPYGFGNQSYPPLCVAELAELRHGPAGHDDGGALPRARVREGSEVGPFGLGRDQVFLVGRKIGVDRFGPGH